MHHVLRKIITDPGALQSRLSGDDTPVAQALRHLTRLSASELLMAIFNSYIYYFHGTRISDDPLLPEQLIQGFTSIDDLYYQVADLYFYCFVGLTRYNGIRDNPFHHRCLSEWSLSWIGDSTPA